MPKLFFADGGTQWGSSDGVDCGTLGRYYKIDQGNAVAHEALLRKIHLEPYLHAVEGGVPSIMISDSGINGTKMHGAQYWITNVLKNEIGFKGIVISDYLGVFMQRTGTFNEQVKRSLKAGIDMFMTGLYYREFFDATMDLVAQKRVPLEHFDDALWRALAVNEQYGLLCAFSGSNTSLSTNGQSTLAIYDRVKVEHRLLARDAVIKVCGAFEKRFNDAANTAIVNPNLDFGERIR